EHADTLGRIDSDPYFCQERRKGEVGMTGRTLRGALFAAALATGVVGASATPAVASPRSGGPANHGENLFGRHHFMGGRSPGTVTGVQVVASGLNQPKKITISPRGNLIVALS